MTIAKVQNSALSRHCFSLTLPLLHSGPFGSIAAKERHRRSGSRRTKAKRKSIKVDARHAAMRFGQKLREKKLKYFLGPNLA